jgi:uncharacterized protein YlaI
MNDLKQEQPDWKKIKTYQKSAVVKIKGKKLLSSCIFCEAEDNITVKALWVDDEKKRVIIYFMCRDCAEDFFGRSDVDRESIVAKLIEPKIDALINQPRLKLSQLIRVGFEIDF